MSVIDQIKAIQEKAQADIEKLKKEAISELAKQIAAKKQELKELEASYIDLTGKNLKGETTGTGGTKKRRQRMTASDKEAAGKAILKFLADNPASSMKAICEACGAPASIVRVLLKELPVKKEGDRASTRYSLASSKGGSQPSTTNTLFN